MCSTSPILLLGHTNRRYSPDQLHLRNLIHNLSIEHPRALPSSFQNHTKATMGRGMAMIGPVMAAALGVFTSTLSPSPANPQNPLPLSSTNPSQSVHNPPTRTPQRTSPARRRRPHFREERHSRATRATRARSRRGAAGYGREPRDGEGFPRSGRAGEE